MPQTIEQLREKQRERYRRKHNVPPERYVNGRSHPDNKDYHREVKRRYYYRHKEELSNKKKLYYQRKKVERLAHEQSRTTHQVGDNAENTGNGDQGQVPTVHGQKRPDELVERHQG